MANLKNSKSQSMGLHKEVLTGRTQQVFFNPEEAENFYYYGAFDAQTIFDSIPEETLQIDIFRGDHTVWCFKCGEVVMMKDCPHEKEDYLLLSGTRVREILSEGKELPPEFSRPEVAKILSEYYQTL